MSYDSTRANSQTFIVTSENLVTNRKHREKFGVAKIDSTREALLVIQQGIQRIEGQIAKAAADNDVVLAGPLEDALPDIGETSRVEGKPANADTVQLTVKLFLRENDRDIAKQAIHQVEKMLSTEHIHNVYVTVPASDVQFIGMSAHSEDEGGAATTSEGETTAEEEAGNADDDANAANAAILDPERERYALDLAALWNDLSQIRTVESLGLCDVETDVFKKIYQQADKKPKNVQVNLKSCCVVPPALKQFAAAKKIKLLTHSDSPEILGDSFCKEVASYGNDDASDKKKWRPLWIVRFAIFKELRGILEDRRYIVALQRSS